MVRGRLEQLFAFEPIMIMAEGRYPVITRQLDLTAHHFGPTLVVVVSAKRDARLVVTGEQRARLLDVHPIGETWSPPAIVFGDGVKLGKIDRDQAGHLSRSYSARMGPGSPSATSRPCDSQSTRRHNLRTVSASWETK